MVRFRVDFTEVCWVGPGKVELLESLQKTGSLRQAARALGMSYRRAWMLLLCLNHSFSEPAAIASIGGQGGGGVTLTPLGLEIMRCYRAAEQAIELAAQGPLEPPIGKALETVTKDAGVRRRRLSQSTAPAMEHD